MALLTATKFSTQAAGGKTVLGAGAAADAAGDSFANTGRELLRVVNADDTVPRTVTIPRTRKVDDQAAADLEVTVAPEEEAFIGPFPPNDYNDADGLVQATYDDESDLTVDVFQVP